MSASEANATRVSCPLPHQKATRCRGAASPRSASPIGPAPTRLPRIAFPLAMSAAPERALEDQPEADDGGEPDDSDDDRDAVQVALRDRGAADRRARTATEHVGEPSALALVQQDQHDHEQARDDEHSPEYDDHRFTLPCRDCRWYLAGPARSVDRLVPEAHDPYEVVDVQAGPADESAVDVALRHDLRDV